MRADVVIIGAGPAGLAAAISARDTLKNAGKTPEIVLLERATEAGGILNQCIHNGFGLHHFGEELTGPEYAGRFIDQLEGIDLICDAMVLEIAENRTVTAISPSLGVFTVEAGAVVLAMGCRERTRGAIGTPGDRPSGVFTAGAAQRYMNIEGCRVGKRAVILGSGDIGLIMARRMTLEGASVAACVELMPYSSGLNRNIVQCLRDYNIPLYLSHTVTRIIGRPRLEAVMVAKVDAFGKPIPGTEFRIDCDTLLLSVGLIPENELTRAAGIPIDNRTRGPQVCDNMETLSEGIFACGNVVHVHDLVDFVTEESLRAGKSAAEYVLSGESAATPIPVQPGDGVGYTVPQYVRPEAGKTVPSRFRVRKPHEKGVLKLLCGDRVLLEKRRTFLAPGEMERLDVPSEILAQASGALTVALEVCK